MIPRVGTEHLLDLPSTRTGSSCGPHLGSKQVLFGETQAVSHTHPAHHHPVRDQVPCDCTKPLFHCACLVWTSVTFHLDSTVTMLTCMASLENTPLQKTPRLRAASLSSLISELSSSIPQLLPGFWLMFFISVPRPLLYSSVAA